jgi:protein-tyrosine phosphatase
MRTKSPKGGGASDPRSPWDEIIPLLFMGGHYYRDAHGIRTAVVVGNEFDLVISLYTRDGHGPSDGVEHRCAEIPDDPLTEPQLTMVCDMAELAADSVQAGRRVLVRCHTGYNRSGLVVGQALVSMGYTADDAIALIRARRSKRALNNALFVDYLTTGLDVARLLIGLEA